MKTQSDLRAYLLTLEKIPTEDPVGFKRMALVDYATRETLLEVWRLLKKSRGGRVRPNLKDWDPIPITKDEVERYLKIELSLAWEALKDAGSKEKHVQFVRILSKVEIALWLLEDHVAIEFVRSPEKYDSRALPLVTWLSERYGCLPDDKSNSGTDEAISRMEKM